MLSALPAHFGVETLNATSTGLATKGQWDTPLVDRVRDGLAAEGRRLALRDASAAELRELSTRLAFAGHMRENTDQYADHVANYSGSGVRHYQSLACLKHQVEDAEAEVSAWWAERAPAPDEVAALAHVSRLLAEGLLRPPVDLPEVESPCDALAVPEGYRFLGDTRGTKLPDGSRGTPHAIFLRESDLTLWVRVRAGRHAGELQGYAGPPIAVVLGTRARG
jgi:hypothetical protein